MVDFAHFVEDITAHIMATVAQDPSRFTSPLHFGSIEQIVVDASQQVIETQQLDCGIDYQHDSHRFPDIVYVFPGGVRYGIEVKSSTKRKHDDKWQLLGNSILGSTRVDVEEIHIVFIKISEKGFFIKSGRYADSVSNVVVTHSPRYKIDLDQDPADSFFARSGISYEEMKEAENPIALVTDYFKRKGETAWWLSESTPATIRSWGECDAEEQAKIYGDAFVLFPELFSSQRTKYERLTKWLVATRSVADSSLRDRFSAGGKVDIHIDGHTFTGLPRVFKVFADHRDVFQQAMTDMDLADLQPYWVYTPEQDSVQNRLTHWLGDITSLLADNPQAVRAMASLIKKIDWPQGFDPFGEVIGH